MTKDECRWAVMAAIEKYWDERMPDRDDLYTLYYTILDPAVDKMLDEIDRKQSEYDFKQRRKKCQTC
jgi:hypothetical protein